MWRDDYISIAENEEKKSFKVHEKMIIFSLGYKLVSNFFWMFKCFIVLNIILC